MKKKGVGNEEQGSVTRQKESEGMNGFGWWRGGIEPGRGGGGRVKKTAGLCA